jgi:hypothetical protein
MHARKIDGDGHYNDQNEDLHKGYISLFAGTLFGAIWLGDNLVTFNYTQSAR